MCKDFVVADRDTDPPEDPVKDTDPPYEKYLDENWGKKEDELIKALADIARTQL